HPDAAHQAARTERLRRHHRARLEDPRERIEVDHLVHDAERVAEAPLRHAPVQRHLAALEPALELEAGPRLGSLVAAPGGLAMARSRTAADPLLRVLRA